MLIAPDSTGKTGLLSPVLTLSWAFFLSLFFFFFFSLHRCACVKGLSVYLSLGNLAKGVIRILDTWKGIQVFVVVVVVAVEEEEEESEDDVVVVLLLSLRTSPRSVD